MPGRRTAANTQPRFKGGLVAEEAIVARKGIARSEFIEWFYDFEGDAGQTLAPPWKFTKTGTSGNNTGDFDSAHGGTFSLTHSGDSEAQTMRLDFGDNLLINTSKKPRVEIRAKINFAGATFSADQRLVIGLASAYNATLDNVDTNAWFRVEGASLNLLAESDDGTTDRDDQATGDAVVDNTFHVFEIEFPTATLARFSFDGVQTHELAMAALAANTRVQPIIAIQRDAANEQEVLTVDYAHIVMER